MSGSTRSADGGTVLIVEDMANLGKLFEQTLAREFTVRRAESCAEAKAALDEDVSAVLLDRILDDGTAEDLIDWMDDRSLSPKIAIISALDPEDEPFDRAVDEYIEKPTTISGLAQTVKELLE